MIVAFLNQKGGTGKTTCAVHFASWYKSQQKSVVFVDADAQQSGSTWLSHLDIPFKTELDPEELFDLLPELNRDYEIVIVDGPASLSEVTKAILYCCDLALIPSRPSELDLHSSDKVLRFLKHARRTRHGPPKAAMFLNFAIKGTVLLREMQEYINTLGEVPLLKNMLYQRQCITDAPSQRNTVFAMSGKAAKGAAQDFEQLFKEALEVTNG